MCDWQLGRCKSVQASRQAHRLPSTLSPRSLTTLAQMPSLLVDARNAFNCLNRKTALHNIQQLCPSIATYLITTYRRNAMLFVGGDVMLSMEGTTQGDPLAMAMYAVAIRPLIDKVSASGALQVWFADDSAGGGKIKAVRQWWELLQQHGLTATLLIQRKRGC